MSAAVDDQRLGRGGIAGSLRLEPLNEGNLPAVLAIERCTYDFPWSEGVFRDCIRSGYWCRVALDGDAVLGYTIMAFGVGEAHILNLCVEPNARRRGVGRELLRRLLAHAREGGAHVLLLEVRPSNRAAIALYEGMNFYQIARRKGYYPARWGREDALILACNIE